MIDKMRKRVKNLKKKLLSAYHKEVDPQLPSAPPTTQDRRKILYIAVFFLAVILVPAGFFLYRNQVLFRSQPEPTPTVQQSQETQLILAPKFTISKDFNKSLQEGPYRCPVTPTFCQAASNFKGNSLVAKITPGSSIYAAFDGEAEIIPSFSPQENNQKEAFTLIILTNQTRKLQAMYYFKGVDQFEKKVVKEGETLVKADGKPLSFMENSPFTFKLIKAGEEEELAVDLSPTDFK